MATPKYKTTFSSRIVKVAGEEIDKYVSLAGLEKLKALMPKDIDLNANPDIIAIVGNAAVGNRMNLNHDCISNKTAVAIAKQFIWKLVDLDHNRHKIVGVICNAGFSEFGTNKPLTEEEVLNTEEPVNLSLAMLLYKVALKQNFIDLLEASVDESSPDYQKLSLSWELFFDDYDIAVGPDKNLSTAKIIKNPEEKEKFEKELPQNQGKGKIDGQLVYRVIQEDNLIPSGVGIVEHPAADVKGLEIVGNKEKPSIRAAIEIQDGDVLGENFKTLITSLIKEQIEQQQLPGGILANSQETIAISTENEKNKTKISQSQNTDVIPNRKVMAEIKKLTDLTDENLKEAQASTIHELVVSEIEKASQQWVKERTEKENAVKAAQDKADALVQDLETAKEQVSQLTTSLNELKSQVEAKEKQELFNTRMAELDETFDLDAEAKKVVAAAIKNMSEEAYTGYKTQLSVLMRGKEKSQSEASVTNVVDDALKTAKPKQEPIGKSGDKTATQTLKEKFAAAFGEKHTKIVTPRKN